MRIEIAQRRRGPLSLTSLIDVIFLLLLFFMLSSTFTRFAAVDVTGGWAAAAGAGERPDVLIRLEDETWSVNGQPFQPEAATTELERLKATGAETAVILVRGNVTSQALVAAVERIRRQTGLTLSVAR